MMGIVVSGLIKISYGIGIGSNSAQLMTPCSHLASLFQPLHRTFLNLPALTPILFIVLISIIFILSYFYRSSGLMSKKMLISSIAVCLLLFISANAWIILKNRPPRLDFRLTMMPLQTELPQQESTWMANALWTMLARNLHASVADKAVIAPPEWIAEIAALDSGDRGSNLKKMSVKSNNEYFLLGEIEERHSLPFLEFEMVRASDQTIVISDSFQLNLPELPETCKQISHRILSYFKLEAQETGLSLALVSPQAYQALLDAQHFYLDRNYESAIRSAKKAIAIDSNLIDSHLLIGKSSFMAGVKRKELGQAPVEEFESARAWLERAIARDSTQSEAYLFLGEYYIYQERWSVAEDLLARSFQLNSHSPRLYLALSRLHEFRFQKLGFQSEEELFKRSIFINPRYEDGYLALADYYLFDNRRQAAIEVLEHYLAIDPNSVPALMALGKIYLLRNEILKIIEVFNRVLELQPKNADAFYNLGILYYNTEDFDTAEQLFLRAIELNNHSNANLYLAYLYEAKGDFVKAIEYLRRRIRLRRGPDDEFAEEARKHLFKLMHGDSTDNVSSAKNDEYAR